MRLLVTGDRFWRQREPIRKKLIELGCPDKIEVLIHGDADGVDKIAAEVANDLGLPKERILAYPANWTKHKKAAGPIRNRQMLKEAKPTQVIAFHDDPASSKGTVDMVKIARKAKIETWVSWSWEDETPINLSLNFDGQSGY